MSKYPQTRNVWTTDTKAGTGKEMIKGQNESETENGRIKGISKTARPGMRQREIEEGPTRNEDMIEGTYSKTDSLDIRKQEPGQSHSVPNYKEDKDLMGYLTSCIRRNDQDKREKGTRLEQKRNHIVIKTMKGTKR